MAMQTYRALILPGAETFVETSTPLSVEDIPANAFGFYFFDADPAEMEEDPKTAERSNVSGKTYVGMVHNIAELLWSESEDHMRKTIEDAKTDRCVVCRYGKDSVMILPFVEGDVALSPIPSENPDDAFEGCSIDFVYDGKSKVA
ncbi:MAG: hypothetical protein OSB62_01280 [Alphaproteobacteria bacterium]|nr:hypothetical protein [Alphaproteobacteria bacterium]